MTNHPASDNVTETREVENDTVYADSTTEDKEEKNRSHVPLAIVFAGALIAMAVISTNHIKEDQPAVGKSARVVVTLSLIHISEPTRPY